MTSTEPLFRCPRLCRRCCEPVESTWWSKLHNDRIPGEGDTCSKGYLADTDGISVLHVVCLERDPTAIHLLNDHPKPKYQQQQQQQEHSTNPFQIKSNETRLSSYLPSYAFPVTDINNASINGKTPNPLTSRGNQHAYFAPMATKNSTSPSPYVGNTITRTIPSQNVPSVYSNSFNSTSKSNQSFPLMQSAMRNNAFPYSCNATPPGTERTFMNAQPIPSEANTTIQSQPFSSFPGFEACCHQQMSMDQLLQRYPNVSCKDLFSTGMTVNHLSDMYENGGGSRLIEMMAHRGLDYRQLKEYGRKRNVFGILTEIDARRLPFGRKDWKLLGVRQAADIGIRMQDWNDLPA